MFIFGIEEKKLSEEKNLPEEKNKIHLVSGLKMKEN